MLNSSQQQYKGKIEKLKDPKQFLSTRNWLNIPKPLIETFEEVFQNIIDLNRNLEQKIMVLGSNQYSKLHDFDTIIQKKFDLAISRFQKQQVDVFESTFGQAIKEKDQVYKQQLINLKDQLDENINKLVSENTKQFKLINEKLSQKYRRNSPESIQVQNVIEVPKHVPQDSSNDGMEFSQKLYLTFLNETRSNHIYELLEKRFKIGILIRNAENSKKQIDEIERDLKNALIELDKRMNALEDQLKVFKTEIGIVESQNKNVKVEFEAQVNKLKNDVEQGKQDFAAQFIKQVQSLQDDKDKQLEQFKQNQEMCDNIISSNNQILEKQLQMQQQVDKLKEIDGIQTQISDIQKQIDVITQKKDNSQKQFQETIDLLKKRIDNMQKTITILQIAANTRQISNSQPSTSIQTRAVTPKPNLHQFSTLNTEDMEFVKAQENYDKLQDILTPPTKFIKSTIHQTQGNEEQNLVLNNLKIRTNMTRKHASYTRIGGYKSLYSNFRNQKQSRSGKPLYMQKKLVQRYEDYGNSTLGNFNTTTDFNEV